MRGLDRIGIGLALAVLVADQGTKLLVDQGMRIHQSIVVVPGFLNLTYVRNTGAAFGLLASPMPGLRPTLLLLFSLVAIGIIVALWIRDRRGTPLQVSSLSLILGGALGNLIDRIRLGEVIDFVDVYWQDLHWPAFNVADSAVTVGVLLLLLHLLFPSGGRSSR